MKTIHAMLPNHEEKHQRLAEMIESSGKAVVIEGAKFSQEDHCAIGVCHTLIARGARKIVVFVDHPEDVLLKLASIPGLKPLVVTHDMTRITKNFNCFIVASDVDKKVCHDLMHHLDTLNTPTFGTLERLVAREWIRQQWSLDCIASESLASRSVCDFQGSILTNKYAEGYPGARYYGGCAVVDEIEQLAQKRVTRLFGCSYANVQPHSGSQANQAVYAGLLKIGDTILGMELAHGGHLTHGYRVNVSGKMYQSVTYGVCSDTFLIDYDAVEKQALLHRPALIIAGASAYARTIDYARFRSIADKVGAYLLVDMAHIAGLVAAGVLPSPFPHAHVVTSTTHKTLKGPRGGLILCDDEKIFSKINKGVFPGVQGGPLMHVIAAKAQMFHEVGTMHYQRLMQRVVDGAQALAQALMDEGFFVLTDGTDNHQVLVDLRPKEMSGLAAEKLLGSYNITVNKNMVPFDTAKPMDPSGLRFGTMALACRGWRAKECKELGRIIAEILHNCGKTPSTKMHKRIKTLCEQYPLI